MWDHATYPSIFLTYLYIFFRDVYSHHRPSAFMPYFFPMSNFIFPIEVVFGGPKGLSVSAIGGAQRRVRWGISHCPREWWQRDREQAQQGTGI